MRMFNDLVSWLLLNNFFIYLWSELLLHIFCYFDRLGRNFFSFFYLFFLFLWLLILNNFQVEIKHTFSNHSILFFFRFAFQFLCCFLGSFIGFGLEWIGKRKSLYFLLFFNLLFDHWCFLFGRFWCRLFDNWLLLFNDNWLLCESWFRFDSLFLDWDLRFCLLYLLLFFGLKKFLGSLLLLLLSLYKYWYYLFLFLLNNSNIFLNFLLLFWFLSFLYSMYVRLWSDLSWFRQFILLYFFDVKDIVICELFALIYFWFLGSLFCVFLGNF